MARSLALLNKKAKTSVDKTETAATKSRRVFSVEALIASRTTPAGDRQYLTKWIGYKRCTWNDEKDFLGEAILKMMVERDLLELAPFFLNWKKIKLN